MRLFFLAFVLPLTSYANSQDSLKLKKDSCQLLSLSEKKSSIWKRASAKVEGKVKELDSFDTLYIEPMHYDWTAMLQNSNFFQIIHIGVNDKVYGRQSISFYPRSAIKIGPYIGWKFIFLGYAFDVTRPKDTGKMSEFSFSVYTNKIGGDIVYIKNSGGHKIRDVKGFNNIDRRAYRGNEFEGLTTHTTSINAYYIFNNRKFSYPAAFNQTNQQKRSAGTFLLGLRYEHQKLNFDFAQLPSALIANSIMSQRLMLSSLDYQNYCINAGYAYNWVFAPNFVFSASLTPSIGYKHLKGEKVTSELVFQDIKRINFDLVGRLGFVWNTGKFFAGASFISHLYDFRREHVFVSNSVNYLNFYAGMNFGLKKKYKK